MIAIVCGGRDFTDAARVAAVLDKAVHTLGLWCIIEGECPTPVNADKIARDWAIAAGLCVIQVPGWKDANGRFCGPERNALMLKILLGGDKDTKRGVFAFPGGNGTKNMVGLARSPAARNVRVIEISGKVSPRVLNRHHGNIPGDAVYCGRGSPYGNPFEIGKDGNREHVIRRFETEVLPDLDVSSLRGKDLVCYCAPHHCHCDSILIKANT